MLVYALYSRGFDDDDILEWMESSANCESAYWCAEYVNERQRTRNIIFIVSARCFVVVCRSLSSFWAPARIPSSPKILWDDITWKTSVFIFTRIHFLFTTRSVASPLCFFLLLRRLHGQQMRLNITLLLVYSSSPIFINISCRSHTFPASAGSLLLCSERNGKSFFFVYCSEKVWYSHLEHHHVVSRTIWICKDVECWLDIVTMADKQYTKKTETM